MVGRRRFRIHDDFVTLLGVTGLERGAALVAFDDAHRGRPLLSVSR
jgi:hypothetical protein